MSFWGSAGSFPSISNWTNFSLCPPLGTKCAKTLVQICRKDQDEMHRWSKKSARQKVILLKINVSESPQTLFSALLRRFVTTVLLHSAAVGLSVETSTRPVVGVVPCALCPRSNSSYLTGSCTVMRMTDLLDCLRVLERHKIYRRIMRSSPPSPLPISNFFHSSIQTGLTPLPPACAAKILRILV